MLNFHKDHKKLVITAFGVYVMLSFVIAVMPAYQMQEARPLPGQPALTATELKGMQTFVSENCMACHTQQVRNIEMDKVWGERPSVPSDYYYSKQKPDMWRQSASLLGSERTGPDLTTVADRQPGQAWHLLHFFNPRIVVKASIMPAYPWLYEEKDASAVTADDVIVPVPASFLKNKNQKIVATREVLDLIAYIQTLKQAPLPGDRTVDFISAAGAKPEKNTADGKAVVVADGKKLYTLHCAACHQPNGKGLPGAFPALEGSPIVNDENPDFMVRIVLQGYDARSEFAQMPGFAAQLSDEEISAIINHERSSWGNRAPAVSLVEVSKIRDNAMKELNQ